VRTDNIGSPSSTFDSQCLNKRGLHIGWPVDHRISYGLVRASNQSGMSVARHMRRCGLTIASLLLDSEP